MSLPLVVVLGAGRSSGWLVQQLTRRVADKSIRLRIVDGQAPAYLLEPFVEFLQEQLGLDYSFNALLEDAFVCVSLLPPAFHPSVMEACLATGTHFISASYESPAAKSHVDEADAKGLLILNECGFDPGIDHVTALAMLNRVQDWGGTVVSFESDSGGLPAVDCLNDWGYRFFWNPINVVTAGSSGARFRQVGEDRLISYPEVFRQYRILRTEGDRTLVAYPNRDSIPYQYMYNLHGLETFIRGTIRYKEYCDRWSFLAEAQVANQAIHLETTCTYSEWAALFRWHPAAFALLQQLVLEAKLVDVPLKKACTSAEVLLQVLMRVWNPTDGYVDRILMRHRIVYEKDGQRYSYTGTLDREGDLECSAMAFMVGLPIAIMIDLILHNPIVGVLTPSASTLWPRIYENLPNHNIKLEYEHLPLNVQTRVSSS